MCVCALVGLPQDFENTFILLDEVTVDMYRNEKVTKVFFINVDLERLMASIDHMVKGWIVAHGLFRVLLFCVFLSCHTRFSFVVRFYFSLLSGVGICCVLFMRAADWENDGVSAPAYLFCEPVCFTRFFGVILMHLQENTFARVPSTCRRSSTAR